MQGGGSMQGGGGMQGYGGGMPMQGGMQGGGMQGGGMQGQGCKIMEECSKIHMNCNREIIKDMETCISSKTMNIRENYLKDIRPKHTHIS